MSPASEAATDFAARWLVPILLVMLIPVLAVAYTWDHNSKLRQYDASIAACERGNLLRIRINTKFMVYDTAFAEAAKTLEASVTPVGKRLHSVLGAAATTAPEALPLTNCLTAFDRPEWFWQR